jgi:hypothetical protein
MSSYAQNLETRTLADEKSTTPTKVRDVSRKVEVAEAQATCHAHLVVPTVRQIYGRGHAQLIRDELEAFLMEHPTRGATRFQAAIHEAGHFVAFEAEGMWAGQAVVSGSPFTRCWGGSALAWDRPWIRPGASVDELLRDARALLAGPWAEAVLGKGDLRSSAGELFQVSILVARAAQLQQRDRHQVLASTIVNTAKIIEAHAKAIEEIASKLMKARSITRQTRGCEKVLDRVRHTPIRFNLAWWQRSRSRDLVRSLPIIEKMITQAENLWP